LELALLLKTEEAAQYFVEKKDLLISGMTASNLYY